MTTRSRGNQPPPVQATAEYVAAALAETSLLHFSRMAWPTIEPGARYVHGWHVEAICEHLEAFARGEIRNLLINMPPRHMKSLLVSVLFPAWVWIWRPETRFLYASYAQSLSIRDNLKTRRLIKSPWYQARWSDRFSLSGDQNAKVRFENNKTGYRLATSVDGTATGEGGDFVLADDPHNVREAESDAVRGATLEWWDQTMSTRLNDPKRGGKLIVMQRVHDDDLAGHVLEQGGYEHLCLPCRYEGKKHIGCRALGWEDPRNHDGELLWPERFDETAVADLEMRLGTYGAAGQLQQRPTPASGGIFTWSWFGSYTRSTLPPVRRVILSFDTAASSKDGADYSVGQVWAETELGYYLIHQERDRLEFPDLIKRIKQMARAWKPAVVLVENKSSGLSAVQTLKRETRLPIVAVQVPSTEGKIVRARSVSPTIEAGRVYIPEDGPSAPPWLGDFRHEVSRFPLAAHDDQVDAMTQALAYMTGKTVSQHWDLS